MRVYDVEQNSPEWYALHIGIPSASAFSNLITGTGRDSEALWEYARKLAIELYTGLPSQSFSGTFHTRRGHELEPEAADEYALLTGAELSIVGFITDDDGRYGCSPDRLVDDDGVLEIKSLSDKEHLALLEYHDEHEDIQPKYIPQLQGEMLVCERDWVDIFFYHPDLPTLTVRKTPDDLFREKLLRKIDLVLAERDRVVAFLKRYSDTPEPAPAQIPSKLQIEI